MIRTRLVLLAALLCAACSNTGTVNTSLGTSGGSGNGTGSQVVSSNSTGAASGSAGISSTGSNGTAAGNSTGSTGNCVPDGSYADNQPCCSGEVDGNGFCVAAAGSTTGAGTTGASTSGGSGPFGGGWHPPDAGYTPPLQGDGGTTIEVDSSAPGNASGLFGGADDPGAKPTILYPPDGVLVPPNMNALEIHFLPAPGQTLFELSFHAPTTNLTVYTGCQPLNGGCVYTPDATFWSALVAYARGTAPVTWTLRGVNGSSPGAVGTSATQHIAFSDQDLMGGIYYWNTSGVVQRYDWGLVGRQAETWMSPAAVGGVCVGCHVLSREGDKAAVGKNIPSPAGYGVYDVATRQLETANGQALTGSANFFSFSPGGRFLLTSNGINITLRDLMTGANVASPAVRQATMPDWAPSGLEMVYAKPASNPFFAEPGVQSGSLEVTQWNDAGFSGDTTLVPFTGQNNYYPAYSPDGTWVAFNRSPSNMESFANSPTGPGDAGNPDGELWVVNGAGGTPVRLDAASDPGALSWPKWAPVVDTYYGGQVMWLTFSSSRPYGLRLSNYQQVQLWMVAFDPAKAAAGQDPSFPAFYLPFQDIGGGNHIAQWVTTVARSGCSIDDDCPGADLCVDGRCLPPTVGR